MPRRPWTRLQKRFQVEWKGYPIQDYSLPPGDITYAMEFEARQAARFVGYPYAEFLKLEGEEQNSIVAHYRMHNRIEAVQADDSQKKAERKGLLGRLRGR